MTASHEVVSRSTRIFCKPSFNIKSVVRQGVTLDVQESVVVEKPFCRLVRFQKMYQGQLCKQQGPRILLVAPLSGHYATLLRDTVHTLAAEHDVFITDWIDAKQVPLAEGTFGFDHYVEYLMDFMRFLGTNFHIIAVCQPTLPVMCAASILAGHNEACQPTTMTLMGGPIDTRINPGKVNEFALSHSMEWFQKKFIMEVPSYYPGGGRKVCPGFLMLSGFMSLNMNRHNEAGLKHFESLLEGNEEKADHHRQFYNEYRAVLDLPAEYYLESINIAFKDYTLAKGKLKWRGYPIQLDNIQQPALLTIEGELDDISCPGQTFVAHELCKNIPNSRKFHYLQKGAGHYGIFNGSRWRTQIYPQIVNLIRQFD